MEQFDTVDLSNELFNELQDLADLKNIGLDEYILSIIEDEILKELAFNYVSDTSIY